MPEPRETERHETEPRRSLPVATGTQVAAHLWRALAGRRARLCGVLALFLVEAATALAFPLVIGSLVDTVIDADGTGVPAAFWWQVGLLAAAAVTAGLMGWIAARTLARIAEGVIAELRESYVAAALDLPRATIEDAGTGDVVTRASDDIAQVSGTLPDVLPRLTVSVFTLVVIATGLGALDVWYLAGFALTVPAYALSLRWYLRTAPPVYAAERTAQSVRGQDVLATLTSLPTVTAHRLEERQLDRISDATWQTARWAMRTRIVQNGLFGRLNITEAAGLLAVLGIGLWLALGGQATPGQVTSAALLFLSIVAPVTALLLVTDDLQIAWAALSRIVGVTDHAPTPRARAALDDVASTGRRGVVSVEDVHHAYRPGTPVLRGVTTRIGPGESVAVVGATGSGKSTLASLVAGIHHPTSGRITRSVAAEEIMTVTQETHVFTGTVRDNLTLSAPEADDERVTDALRRVGAEGLTVALPDGLDTPVGDGEHSLTAAQAQHLALARLALADPALVILDEATAEADSSDADLLTHAASVAVEGRAALVIAHRLSQAAAADRIVVLDEGRVCEHGDHDSLVAAGGVYARLWAAWNDEGATASGAFVLDEQAAPRPR